MYDIQSKTKDEEHKNMINGYIKIYRDMDRFELYETEYKFNYYGDRGYIDLLAVTKDDYDGTKGVYVYEFKTDIVGVGDMIRQVKNYTENTRRIMNRNLNVDFLLECNIIIYDTIFNLKHLYDNIEYYYTALYNNKSNFEGNFYTFCFIDLGYKIVRHVGFYWNSLETIKTSLHDSLYGIEHTKSNTYKEYCDLCTKCHKYLLEIGARRTFEYPNSIEVVDWYKKGISVKSYGV